MDPYYNPFNISRYMMNEPSISFRDFVIAVSRKRRKPKTVKRNKKSKKNRR